MKIIELKYSEMEHSGVTAISIVRKPAIEKNFIKFSAEEEAKFKFLKVDEAKQIIAGPVMIPDKQIFRSDEEGEYFVFFSEDTIRKLAERFFLDGKLTATTVEHQDTLNGVSIIESWIVEDSKKDKSNSYGFELPVGSWFCLMKVNNKAIWESVKRDELQGFSIEGIFTDKLIKNQKEMDLTKLADAIIEKLNSAFSITPTVVETEAEGFGEVLALVKADGSEITIIYEGETLEAGVKLLYDVEGEKLPVPTGEYELESGQILIVAEEGILGEIRAGEEKPKEEPEAEEMTKEVVVAAVKEAMEEILGLFTSQVEADIEKASTELRAEFSAPAEKPIIPEPEPEPVVEFKSLNQKIRDLK